MTKHRMITGFVAIVLLAAAAAAMRSQSPSTADSVALTGMTPSRELTASVNPTSNSSDQSPGHSTSR